MQFKRSLGPIGLMFTAVSGIMGSAWLFGPYYAAQSAGPAAIVAWIVGGLAMMVIAMTFAELVCMLPISGGNARFIFFSHGVLASFIFSWLMWLGYAAVAPVETMGVLQYLSSAFPWLTHEVGGHVILTHVGYQMAALILLVMCVINFLSVKWVARYNAVMVWLKVGVPLIVAVVLLFTLFKPHNFTHFGGFMPYGWHSIATTLSVGGVIFAFAGYAPAIVLAGEAKNPQKTVPLVLFGALGLCLFIYLILEVAFIGAQHGGSLTQGWQHLHFSGDASPFVGMAQDLHLGYLKDLIFLTAIFAPLGTAFIFIATSSRVAYAMSRNGYFPHIFQTMNGWGVPFIAVILNFVFGLLIFFPSPTWQGMVGFLVSAFVLCYAIGPISLIAFRSQLPDHPRKFRLPFAMVWSFFAIFFANLIVYWTGWKIFSAMCIAMVVGIVILIAMMIKQRCRNNTIRLEWRSGLWAIAYFVGMGCISYAGDYGGGHHFFPDGWGIGIIAIFTLIILFWSHASRLSNKAVAAHIEAIAGEH